MGEAAPVFTDALGRTIQVLRTDRGIDRKDLAAQAAISYSYLSAIESGKKQASSAVLRRIAHALGLRSHELFASAEQRVEHDTNLTRPAPTAWMAPTARDLAGIDAEALVAAFTRLPAADRAIVWDLIRRLVERA